ncbi:MAG TPA: ATP-binding protein [Thermoanaerobaculia bacterium]|nr:ATP-binding protein [Thermoanaerobaculia bacterium]
MIGFVGLARLRIRGKLLAIVMAATASALLLAGAVLLWAEWLRGRRELVRDLEALAAIVADQTSAAVAFVDPGAATEVLRSLHAKEHVAAACVYLLDGRRFAAYGRRGGLGSCPATAADATGGSALSGQRIDRGVVELWVPIAVGEHPGGMVFLRSDLRWLAHGLRLQAVALAAALALAALGAFLLSLRLQRIIASPIQELAAAAAAVREGDYAVRVKPRSVDEVGELVEGFNRMLAQIEQRDAALLATKGALEARVDERTRALAEELRERRRAEAELERKNRDLEASNRELDDFAYVASHDLKEPLRGIHNYAGFLLEDYQDQLDDAGREKLQTLMRLSGRMESLIDTLLHYSRVGRVDLAVTDVDLAVVVAELLDQLRPALSEASAEVRVVTPLPVVHADRARVDEVFRDLVVNGVKYNDSETPTVEIGALAPGSPAGGETPPGEAGPVFFVRDNGIGIPARHQQVIFDIFKRLHGRDAYGGGTGAGLTIVKKVVERHGGRIWVESAPGEGTTFFFTLPGAGGDKVG